MIIKKSCLLIFFIILSSLNVFPQKKNETKGNNNTLIGRWATISKPDEKTRTILEFSRGGKVEYDITVPFSGSYIVSGSKVITFFKDPKQAGTEIDTSVINIVGDTLYQRNYHDGKEIVIRSVRLRERDGGRGMIGKWITQDFNGHKAIQEFTNQNIINVDLIVRAIKGTYTTSGNTFTLNLKFTPPLKSKFSIKGDIMTIERYDKKGTSELIRIDKK